MKSMRKVKCLLLVLIAVCSVIFAASITSYAAKADGSTEVIARIETVSEDSTQAVTDNTDVSVPDDGTSILTGDITSGFIIALFLLMTAAFIVLYLFAQKNKHR